MKSKKTKVGELEIKSSFLFGNRKKPIWAWIENNYYTGKKNNIVLNINFKPEEAWVIDMLYTNLINKLDRDTLVNIENVNFDVDIVKDSTLKMNINYYKLFINIETAKTDFGEVIDSLHRAIMRSVTTFKPVFKKKNLDRFKLRAVAELL